MINKKLLFATSVMSSLFVSHAFAAPLNIKCVHEDTWGMWIEQIVVREDWKEASIITISPYGNNIWEKMQCNGVDPEHGKLQCKGNNSSFINEFEADFITSRRPKYIRKAFNREWTKVYGCHKWPEMPY